MSYNPPAANSIVFALKAFVPSGTLAFELEPATGGYGLYVKTSTGWKQGQEVYVKVAGTWRLASSIRGLVSGSWVLL